MHRLVIPALFALAAAACTPVVQGGEPMPIAPELAAGAHIGAIRVSSDWISAEDDITATFTDEVREELSRCATGARTLDLNVHIDDLNRASRLGAALNGSGMNALAATAEFTDPAQGGAVVGRYRIIAHAPVQGRVEGIFADRQMVVSEEWGRELCRDAFGQNPRAPGLHNATPN